MTVKFTKTNFLLEIPYSVWLPSYYYGGNSMVLHNTTSAILRVCSTLINKAKSIQLLVHKTDRFYIAVFYLTKWNFPGDRFYIAVFYLTKWNFPGDGGGGRHRNMLQYSLIFKELLESLYSA